MCCHCALGESLSRRDMCCPCAGHRRAPICRSIAVQARQRRNDRLSRRTARPRVHARYQRACAGSSNPRSEEHTSELQSLIRTSYAVLCLKKITTATVAKIVTELKLNTL